jgi:hypothetical protein
LDKIFLSFSFQPQDRELSGFVEQLLASHNLQVATGRRLGGEALTQAIMNRISECDGLVALLTRRDQLAAGGWTTHPWVRDEMSYARNTSKRAIALVEEGVNTGGAYNENEFIVFNRDHPFDAFLALSDTIGLWKREAGRTLKIRILPENVGRQVVHSANALCRYRFMNNGIFTEWKQAVQVPEIGGAFVYINGVQDDSLIQLWLEDGVTRWESPATSQWVNIELEPVQAGGNP